MIGRFLKLFGRKIVSASAVVIDDDADKARLLAAQESGRTVARIQQTQETKLLLARLEALENDRRFLAVENEALKARVAVRELELGASEARLAAIEEEYSAIWDGATRH